jgi:hypothetical protein
MPQIALCLALWVVAQPQSRIEYHTRLDKAKRMPVVVSPDGEQVLYFSGDDKTDDDGRERPTYFYSLAKIDGSDQRRLFETPADWDDFLNTVTTNAFSADGKSIAVATTNNGKSLRAEAPGLAIPGICSLDGKVQPIECELGSTSGFGFAGNDFVFLDTPGIITGQGYKLKVLRDGKTQVIDSDKDRVAVCLRISPDGTRAMFFTTDHIHSTAMRVRVVDLKSGEKLDSPEFNTQDATFDGRPQLFWDATGEGFFCHVSTHAESKWPYELTHFNLASGKGFVASPTRNTGATCVLDDKHVAVWQPDGRGCSVVNVTNRDQYFLPENNYIIGGRGRQVIVADLERDAVYCATIELLQPGDPPALSEDTESLDGCE